MRFTDDEPQVEVPIPDFSKTSHSEHIYSLERTYMLLDFYFEAVSLHEARSWT